MLKSERSLNSARVLKQTTRPSRDMRCENIQEANSEQGSVSSKATVSLEQTLALKASGGRLAATKLVKGGSKKKSNHRMANWTASLCSPQGR